jgi:hypothetical protein
MPPRARRVQKARHPEVCDYIRNVLEAMRPWIVKVKPGRNPLRQAWFIHMLACWQGKVRMVAIHILDAVSTRLADIPSPLPVSPQWPGALQGSHLVERFVFELDPVP